MIRRVEFKAVIALDEPGPNDRAPDYEIRSMHPSLPGGWDARLVVWDAVWERAEEATTILFEP